MGHAPLQKVLLILLDGFGIGKKYPGNAYYLAKKPHLEAFFEKYPFVTLKASGNAVGVPEGTQGGSEVGHFTIGAGRIVWQTLESINRAIRDKSFFRLKPFLKACQRIRKANQQILQATTYKLQPPQKALHLIGMISDQGVHSHLNHLFALLELVKKETVWPVYIHAILDGRDAPEKSALLFMRRILEKIRTLRLDREAYPSGPRKASVATIIGRYYAMDRDMNFKVRTEKAYDLYTLGKGLRENDPMKAIEHAYSRGVSSDYYVEPILLDRHGLIKDDDSVIHFNFRTDRNRQLTWAFTGEKPPKETGLSKIGFKPKKVVRPYYVCMGPYSQKADIAFPTPRVKHNLGEILSQNHVRQLRIAETEKYAHVTFFLNSQRERPFHGENRILIHSPKTPSYAKKPEMSAFEITHRLIKELEKNTYGFVVVNFANCDLVGHSGVLKAAVKAVEVIDECLGEIVPVAQKHGYTVMITGDHGNVEYMIYDKNPPTGKTEVRPGEPCPSHTTNPVPCIIIANKTLKRKVGGLQDVAPTILKLFGLQKPREMTGKSLV